MSQQDPLATFPHHRLDAYHVALELCVAAHRLAESLPRGHAKLADNLRRAGTGIPLLVAEGANRWPKPQKRQRFTEAQGETGECSAGAEIALGLGVGSSALAVSVRQLAAREGAMLTRLILRCR